jgi:ArsR family transcriptional regulator, arsenate/arsenite/antimonite-responsive transcriptional repressor
MAQNKKGEFSTKYQALASYAKVFSHPARLAILNTIANRGECICGEVVEVLPLAQSTVSQHLKELKESGLIAGEVDGLKSCYCVNWKKVEEMEKVFLKFIDTLKEHRSKNECC